jgi:trk system potassium uptake protein TrkH
MVFRQLGQISLTLAVLLLVPTLFAAVSGDWDLARWLGGASLAPALALAVAAGLPPARGPLQANEALVVAALAFVLAAALMSPALTASGMPLADAWFEAVSGVTTTGLSMVTDPEDKSPAFLFARSWMQWFGGLGIIVLSLALAPGRAADMRRMADTVSEEEDLGASVRTHARQMVVIYPLLTLAAVAGVWAAGLPPFQAVIHSLSAVSTGGFSGFSGSLADVPSSVRFTLLAAAFLGALPLLLLHRGVSGGWAGLWRDLELRALVAAVLITTLGLSLFANAAAPDVLAQALSAQTGTGFSTIDIDALDPQAKLVLILSMVTGAGVGSTAGGVKLLRVLILIRVVQITLLRVHMPRHAVLEPELGGRALRPEQIQHALVVALLFLAVIICSWLPFIAAGYPPLDALFEVVSATATVGLSTGIATPELDPWLKGLLTLDMLAGRVEIVALLVLLYPGTWHRPR